MPKRTKVRLSLESTPPPQSRPSSYSSPDDAKFGDKVLLSFDTDRIKSYVFATGNLRDIRGASALLDRLNRHEMPKIVKQIDPSAEQIYAHGGSGMFIVNKSQAELARVAVERAYQDRTSSASITGAWVPLPIDWKRNGDIQEQFRTVSYRLRAAKDRSAAQIRTATHALLHPCDVCGEYPASEQSADANGKTELICDSCAAKRREDAQVLQGATQMSAGLSAAPRLSLWSRFIATLREKQYPLTPKLERPARFHMIGEQSTPEGYFGLIYADGDGMGQFLEAIQTTKDMTRFAESVDRAIYQSLAHAAAQHLKPGPHDNHFPFDVLLLGGDDVVLVTTADKAILTALTLVESFASYTKQSLGQPLRLSASVILSHIAYPFSALQKLAESTLKFAKKEAARRRHSGTTLTTGLISFLAISGGVDLDFADYYQGTLTATREFYRTLRPYTPEDLRAILAACKQLGEAPRAKLHQLRDYCFHGNPNNRVDALAALLQWRSEREKAALVQLVQHFNDNQLGQVKFPWCRTAHGWATPLIDLIELFEFLS